MKICANMRCGTAIADMVAGTPAVAIAQDAAPERFLTCVDDTIRANMENPFVDLMAIVICGERYAPPRQSCVGLQYMLPHTAPDCEAQDLAYWSGQRAIWVERTIAEGGVAQSSLFQTGLDRCAEDLEIQSVCETELHWREVMGFSSNDVRREIFGPARTE